MKNSSWACEVARLLKNGAGTNSVLERDGEYVRSHVDFGESM